MTEKTARIGIDVGGTNTDAVLMMGVDLLASIKKPTSSDIQTGVYAAAKAVMEQANIPVEQITDVMIGTTQFTNAFVERKKLTEIGVIRVALPATASVRPYTDWPSDLLDVIGVNIHYVDGGHEFDGREIAPLDEDQIRNVAEDLKVRGIREIAISGVFSPVNISAEERVAELVREVCPDMSVTLSNEIGRLGLIERENASCMNASLSRFAGDVLDGFRAALEELKIQAPLYISQNDGTIMNEEHVRRYPVLTFASGPTNSMRGAAYTTSHESAIVVDIGGTTTDIGILVNGFPRESSVPVDIGGVRTNFRMPDIISIGLGGGSIVRRRDDGSVTIGPDSVGYQLTERALVFGGDTLTTTDIIVAAGRHQIGDPGKVRHLDKALIEATEAEIHRLIENAIDKVKTSKEDAPVILVGGGAILVSRPLSGASEVVIPENSGVANAIGAAKAQIGFEIDRIFSYEELGRDAALTLAKDQSREGCRNSGADEATIDIIDVEELPLTYLPGGAVRVRVKAVGDLAK